MCKKVCNFDVDKLVFVVCVAGWGVLIYFGW